MRVNPIRIKLFKIQWVMNNSQVKEKKHYYFLLNTKMLQKKRKPRPSRVNGLQSRSAYAGYESLTLDYLLVFTGRIGWIWGRTNEQFLHFSTSDEARENRLSKVERGKRTTYYTDHW